MPPQRLLYLYWSLFIRGYSSWDVHLAILLCVVIASGSVCVVICRQNVLLLHRVVHLLTKYIKYNVWRLAVRYVIYI
jgi:hypothetical protein